VAPAEDRRGLFGAQFGAVEDFAGSMEGMKVCTIRAPFFLDNMWGDVDTIKSHDTFYAPVASDVRQLAAAVADVGEALAVGAVNEKFAGKGFFVLGDHITKGEVAALYSKKLGRKINHVQASVEAATAAMKGFGFVQWQIDGVLELNGLNHPPEFMSQHHGDFKQLTGRDPMSASQYLDAVLIPVIAPPPVVVVQNVGNAGLYAIKTLISKGGYKVRTASRNPDKLKSTKLAGLDV